MVSVIEVDQPQGAFLSSCGGGSIPVVTVSASVPFSGTAFLGFLGVSSFNLTASHSEMWMGL
jgi:hypothetical protein